MAISLNSLRFQQYRNIFERSQSFCILSRNKYPNRSENLILIDTKSISITRCGMPLNMNMGFHNKIWWGVHDYGTSYCKVYLLQVKYLSLNWIKHDYTHANFWAWPIVMTQVSFSCAPKLSLLWINSSETKSASIQQINFVDVKGVLHIALCRHAVAYYFVKFKSSFRTSLQFVSALYTCFEIFL